MYKTEISEVVAYVLTAVEREHAQSIRAQLPLQGIAKQIEEAEFLYHTVPWRTASKKIRHTLPRRLLKRRFAIVWKIDQYPRFIPDEVLLKWQEAKKSLLFNDFWIAEPSYEPQVSFEHKDPWLLGLRVKDAPPFWNTTPVSIIAHWE